MSEVLDLQNSLAKDPLNESLYLKLLEKYESDEYSKMRESLRETYLEKFLPSPDFWISWIQDTLIDAKRGNSTADAVIRVEYMTKSHSNFRSIEFAKELFKTVPTSRLHLNTLML
jgi:hypothetical protein